MRFDNIIKDYGRLEKDVHRLANRASAEGLTYEKIFKSANPKRMAKRFGAIISVAAAGLLFYNAASEGWLSRTEPPQTTQSVARPPSDAPTGIVSPAYAKASHEDDLEKQVNLYITAWKRAWETGEGYSGMYDKSFISDRGENLERFLARKDGYLDRRNGTIEVSYGNLQVTKTERNKTCIQFLQHYKSNEYSDTGIKEMCISMDGDKLGKIVSEKWRSK